MTKIVILGTGGNCVDVCDALDDINRISGRDVYCCVGFLDDDEAKHGKMIAGIPVLGPLQAARDLVGISFIFGIASPFNHRSRRAILERCGLGADRFATIVHPSAVVSMRARLGRGVVLFPHVTICSNATLGDHILVLPNSVVSHDDVIGDYTCIAGGVNISGNVTIGESCYLGTNAAIKGHVCIGHHSLIGMGSIVLNDVAPRSVVVGNPARVLRRYDE